MLYTADDIVQQVKDIMAEMDPVEAMDFLEEVTDGLTQELEEMYRSPHPFDRDYGPEDEIDRLEAENDWV